ncbi:MAG: sigma-70 family RNA polymerase sigma factor [Planctomycetota bacterium]
MTTSILKRVGSGDPTAMTECIDRYGSLVWTLAKRRGLSTSDAEDLVQDVFVELWKTAKRFDESIASEATFIAMITRRRLVDRIRKLGRVPQSQVDLDSASQIPAVSKPLSTELRDEAAHARRMMSQLRDEERTVLELAIDEGLSQSQIAERINQPLGTVKTNARRGMIRLRQLLQENATQSVGGQR